MVLAFKKTRRSGWHAVIDWIQATYTGGAYVHVEISCGDDLWYSSTGKEGCRIKKMDLDPKKWDFLTVPTTPEQTALCWEWCDRRQWYKGERRGYDFLGVTLSIVFPLNAQDSVRDYCNETCHKALQYIGLLLDRKPNSMDPNRFYKYVKEHTA